MERARMIRLGLIGCGEVTALRHLPALRRVREMEVVALADIDAARLERVANEFGVARRYGDYAELIESGDVDAVAVCVPSELHAEVALAALAAGKHVLIEKPLALRLAECDLLMERANAHGALKVKVMVGFNLRRHRLVREAREVIRRGDLGEIKLARTVFTSGVRLRAGFADWRRAQASGGGALFELGMHHFDLLRFLLGCEAEEVYAASAASDETATVSLRMTNDAQVVAAFSESTGENHTIEIYGARGWLQVSLYRADGLAQFGATQYAGALGTRLRKLTRTLLTLPRVIRQARHGGDYVASYVAEWQHFADAIRRDAPVECTLDDGRRALEIALAAREAGATKRAVRLGHTDAEARIDGGELMDKAAPACAPRI